MLESDQERWVTYAEAGQLLGISTQAARMFAKRRGWPRRTPNAFGDRALVLVPADAIVQPRSALFGAHTGFGGSDVRGEPNGHVQPNDSQHDHPNNQVIEHALNILHEQLDVANRRADHAEQRADTADKRADAAEHRADRVEQLLVEARVAEKIAVERVKELEEQIQRRRWWRWGRS